MGTFRHGHKSHHVLTALSALDNATWDLRGRALGVPVYELLGGPTRDRLQAYASCISGSTEPEAAKEQAKAVRAEGWTAQKWFLWGNPRWSPGRDALEHHTALATAIREGAGPDYDVMFDGVMTWEQNYALRLCRRLDDLEPLWVEEAVASNQLEGFRRIKAETNIPLAAGEHLYTRWDVKPYLEAGVLDFLQCDPEWTGGVSEMVRICNMASAWGVKVVPHGHHVTAALHVVASQPVWTCPMMEYLVHFAAVRQFFHREPLKVADGTIQLPTSPGMGIEIDESKILNRNQETIIGQ
jgi:L-alanine-DL-glutamate epimerase-like enolase superfamily enzyme